MKMQLSLLFCSFIFPLYSKAAHCPLPPTNDINTAVKNLAKSEGGEGNAIVTVLDGPYYTCQVQGATMGTYTQLSAIMTYNTDNNPTVRVVQFELDCIFANGVPIGFDGRSNSLLTISASVDYMNISVFTNCSACTGSNTGTNHCQGCDSNCNIGLMRCTGTGSDECCAAFKSNGTCNPDLTCDQNDFVANEQNNFTCACGITCGDGKSLNSTACACDLDDICLADNPCINGQCMLGSLPDQYTCDCTGTNYMGTNCSVEIPIMTTTSSVLLMTTTISNTVSSAMVSPSSTVLSCSNNCRVCSNGCCSSCFDDYDVNGCMCVISIPPPPVSCNLRGCETCSNSSCCSQCTDGYITDRNNPCSCVETGGASSSVSVTPTSNTERNTGLSNTGIIGIIVSIVVGVLMMLALIAMIVYVIYYFMAGAAFAANKAKYSGPIMLGEAHDNPMYLDPELIAS